ncbi:MAG: hypothetical protein P8X95_25995 [Anaerolineales bacterium]
MIESGNKGAADPINAIIITPAPKIAVYPNFTPYLPNAPTSSRLYRARPPPCAPTANR